jgi:high-affinity iron transporter
MIGQLLIVLREGFEASLVISIILAYLIKTNRKKLIRYVWYGVFASVVISFLIGLSIWMVYGSLSEATQVLFEGVAAWIAVVVLSSMIYWMASKGSRLRIEIEKRVEEATRKNIMLGFFTLSFILVFREAMETVLFLIPFMINDTVGSIIGGVIGAVISVSLAYLVFIIGINIDIKKFFYLTSILLVLLAGG